MNLNGFVQEYRTAWRTLFYFAFFAFLLGVFSLPLRLLDLLNDKQYPVISEVIRIACLLAYLPFCILWASRVSGFRLPTKEEAERQHREAVRRKNAELKRENRTVSIAPASGRSQSSNSSGMT